MPVRQWSASCHRGVVDVKLSVRGDRAASRKVTLRPVRGGWHIDAAVPLGSSGGRCLNDHGPILPVRTIDQSVFGAIPPGSQLKSVIAYGPDPTPPSEPQEPHYAGGSEPGAPPWRAFSGAGVPVARGATFNGDAAAYRTAHHNSYFGINPIPVGDVNGDGVGDVAFSDHWATVDGGVKRGEVQIYFGRRGAPIDPVRDVPDVVVYGDEELARLGIGLAGAGDVNGDGYADIVMAAAFATGLGGEHDAGRAYVLFGGWLGAYRCTQQVRITDVAERVPGLVLAGGADGSHYIGWSNGLDAGDFDGDGLSDVVIGAASPYENPDAQYFPARVTIVYGSRTLPLHDGAKPLGEHVRGLRTSRVMLPSASWTRGSIAFDASGLGDLDRDGDDELGIAAGAADDGLGGVFVFAGRPGGFGSRTLGPEAAGLEIRGGPDEARGLRYAGLDSVRPVGDVDGDGWPDLLVTARKASQPVAGEVGAVAVVRGGPNLLFGSRRLSSADLVIVGERNGSVAMAGQSQPGDLDGDGRADVMINDPYYTEDVLGAPQYRGRAWIYRGRSPLPATLRAESDADLTVLADTTIPGLLGFGWTFGDLNADGRPEILIGDHWAGDNERRDHVGRAYVLYNGRDFGF